MRVSENIAKQKLTILLHNNRMLPPDIFDENDCMHPKVSAHIRKIIQFFKKEIISFIKAPLEDVICYGGVCSFIFQKNSDIDIAFIFDIPSETIKDVCLAFERRGFVFNIGMHRLRFRVKTKEDILGANWSILHNGWNQRVNMQEFKFNIEEFYMVYSDLDRKLRQEFNALDKDVRGFYTLQSLEYIKERFVEIEQKALEAYKNSLEQEYSLDYNILLALDLFGVRKYYEQEIIKAECEEFNKIE